MSEASCIDLHTHSNRSDGALAPADLLALAASRGVKVLALTDHDCVAGIDEAETAAKTLGMRLVAGTEISASWRNQSIHILGLSIDATCPQLLNFLAGQAERRIVRMRAMCEQLTKARLPGRELFDWVLSRPGIPTRTHLATALVTHGHARNAEDAFRRYLRPGRSGFRSAQWPTIDAAVAIINDAGGIASLAHPARYTLSAGARRRMIQDFAAAGGTALEVVSGGNGAQHVDTCAALAHNLALEGSIGSDFHDPQHLWNPLGRLAKLPERIAPVWRRFGL